VSPADGDARQKSQSSGGLWGGAWAVGIGPTGEPARYFFRPRLWHTDVQWSTPLFGRFERFQEKAFLLRQKIVLNYFFLFPDQNPFFPVGNMTSGKNVKIARKFDMKGKQSGTHKLKSADRRAEISGIFALAYRRLLGDWDDSKHPPAKRDGKEERFEVREDNAGNEKPLCLS
jgi:hypothetical protein